MSATSRLSPNMPGPSAGWRMPGSPRMWWLAMLPAAIAFAVLSWLSLGQLPAPAYFRVDFSPFLAAPPVIQVHAGSAIATFFLGCYLMWAPKGVGLHKQLGWTWVGLMALTAVSSFFIRTTIMDGSPVGPIHALSAWTLIGLPMGVAAIRRRNVKAHRRLMTGMFLGGMAIAGLFTFLPGRLMWSLFFTY